MRWCSLHKSRLHPLPAKLQAITHIAHTLPLATHVCEHDDLSQDGDMDSQWHFGEGWWFTFFEANKTEKLSVKQTTNTGNHQQWPFGFENMSDVQESVGFNSKYDLNLPGDLKLSLFFRVGRQSHWKWHDFSQSWKPPTLWPRWIKHSESW